jgi:hypothetical protein
LTAGDLLFFYHTKSARKLIKNMLAEVHQIQRQSCTISGTYTADEIQRLVAILERINEPSRNWTGKIFAVAEVSGSPQYMFDENKHFKGTIYAPLASVFVFQRPVSSDEFAPFLKIGQNTVTPVYGDQFKELKELLAKQNTLPAILANAVPGDLSFRDVNKDNWIDISCRKDASVVSQ